MSFCLFRFDDNSNAFYYPGQRVSGTIRLLAGKPEKIRAIVISVVGIAKIRKPSGTRFFDDKTDYKTIEYISTRNCLMGDENGELFEIPSGVYRFSFEVQLPEDLPYSFSGLCGYIGYKVVLTVLRPRFKYDNIFEQPFIVFRSLDLNEDKRYRIPVALTARKKFFNYKTFRLEHLKATLHLPLTGFVPGQNICFNVTIQNQTNVICTDAKVRLLNIVTYKFGSSVYHDFNAIEAKNFGGVEKYSTKEINNSIPVPLLLPSSLGACDIIKVWYCLQLLIQPAGAFTSFHLSIPITIGTVPILKQQINRSNIKIQQSPKGLNNLYSICYHFY